MVSLRYKKLKSGKFSAYLDIYTKGIEKKGRRNYEFLSIYVTKDYSLSKARIAEEDKEKVKLLQAIRNKRETEINFARNGYEAPEKINYNLLDYFKGQLENKYRYKLECVIIHLEKFLTDPNITFSNVTTEFLEKFQDHLLSKVSRNTTSAYMGVFRQYFNKLEIRGLIKRSPFKDFKPVDEEYLERTTLTIEEVRVLATTIPKRGNHQIRQAFLFACFTGLRISDIKKLNYQEIDGTELVFRPQKTSKKILRIPLTEDARKILSNISRHPINNKVFWDLPSSQVMNVYLKFWGLEAGIKKNLHFHASRHTFATIGLTYGIDIYTMKELLGHSKIEMTQVYAKIVDQKKKEEMLKFPIL